MGGKKNFEVIVVEYDERKIRKVIDIHAFAVPYEDADHLVSRASLVVLGKPVKSENAVTKDSEGKLIGRFTLTEVELTNLFTDKTGKKYKVGDIIKVAEPNYVMDDRGTGLVKITRNEYEDLEKEKEYLLVLQKEVGVDELYGIVGMELGKHRLNLLGETSVLNPHPLQAKKDEFRFDLFERFNLN